MEVDLEDEEDVYEVASGANTRVAQGMREDSDQELREMIEGFGADKGYQLKIIRTAPKKIGSTTIEGHIGTFEEWQTEEDLKSMFGGGTFQCKVFRPNAKGSMQYFRAVSVKIAGEPKGEGVPVKEMPQQFERFASEGDGAVDTAMSTMRALIEDSRSNKGNGGMDVAQMTAFFNTMMAPIQAQIAAGQATITELNRASVEKDNRILELISKPPDTSKNDGLLNKMFDTEASRSDHLRQMHESEMRQLRENSQQDIKRSEDRHREELRSREDTQRREIDNLTRSNDAMLANVKMSYESRIESYKKDIERGDREVLKLEAELVVLRAKKDKTLIEQASELASVRDALEGFGGGKGDDGEDNRKWYEKILTTTLENPESVGQFVGMMTGQNNPARQQQQQMPAPQQQRQIQPPQQPSQQQQQTQETAVEDIPIGQPFKDENGDIFVKVPPDGSIVPYAQALAMAEAAEARQTGGLKKPSPGEVKIAISFMESAFQAGTEAPVFAQGARSMIPGAILEYMEAVGIDKFLNETAVLDQNSPLRNQAGRTFMRDVAKFLLEGV
jgi:hypothetical protein